MAQSDRDEGSGSRLSPHDNTAVASSIDLSIVNWADTGVTASVQSHATPSPATAIDQECGSSLNMTEFRCRCVVLVLAGLPGAGKSTVADAIRRRVSTHSLAGAHPPDDCDGCDGGADGACGPGAQRVITTTAHSAALPSRVEVLSYDDYIDDPARSVAGPEAATTGPLLNTSLESSMSATVSAALVAGVAVGDAHSSASAVSHSTMCDKVSHEAKTYSADRRALVSRVGAWLDACQGRATTDEPGQVTTDTDHDRTDDDYRLLVIDDNMYYTSMRYAVYQAVRARSAGFATMMLQCDADTAQARNRSRRTATVHPDVIQRMAARIEPPRPDKNGWEVNSIVIDSSKRIESTVDAALELCLQARANPMQPPRVVDTAVSEADRAATIASVTHQFDVATRGLLGDELVRLRGTGVAADVVRGAAGDLNTARKQALKKANAEAAAGATIDDLLLDFRLELDTLAMRWSRIAEQGQQ